MNSGDSFTLNCHCYCGICMIAPVTMNYKQMVKSTGVVLTGMD